MMKSKLFIVSFLTLLFLVTSCNKDTEQIIPTYRFNIKIDGIATDPQYTQNNPFIIKKDPYGNTIGNAGVVIFMLTTDEYYVFDLMCPYEKAVSSLVEIEEKSVHCICPTCGSKFAISIPDGALLEGPSKWSLYPYNSEVRDGALYIWN